MCIAARIILVLCSIGAGASAQTTRPATRPATRPISGKASPRFEAVDRAVISFMDLIDARAATVAITMNGVAAYSRGYGWLDEAETKPTPPDALMRIASVTKPITAAAIRKAIAAKKVSPETKAFEFIGGGEYADARVATITVGQLLEHKGGWDRKEAAFDPMFYGPRIARELNLGRAARPEDVVRYMMGRPLQFAPGERVAYSNFGYCVLGRVLERAMKRSYYECLEQAIFRPLGIKDIRLARDDAAARDPREVWYPDVASRFSVELMDANGGLVASAPALGQFMRAYWLSGDLRRADERWTWHFFGSLPGTTAMVLQRKDGVDVAVLFNARRDEFEADNEALKRAMDEAMDAVIKAR